MLGFTVVSFHLPSQHLGKFWIASESLIRLSPKTEHSYTRVFTVLLWIVLLMSAWSTKMYWGTYPSFLEICKGIHHYWTLLLLYLDVPIDPKWQIPIVNKEWEITQGKRLTRTTFRLLLSCIVYTLLKEQFTLKPLYSKPLTVLPIHRLKSEKTAWKKCLLINMDLLIRGIN